MRLHRVRLRNYRGLAASTVEFAADGVTIIEGDNEVGKTSIPEALDLILSELDSSEKRRVRAIRPVHRDEGPEVEIELSSGDYRFVYAKRWHRRPMTTLEVTSPRREQLTGRPAHQRVSEILAETLDDDLWQALRIEQGVELHLPPGNVPSLGRALDMAAGGVAAGAGDDDLWERICTERDRYFTPTGQINQDRKALESEVKEAREAVVAVEDQLTEIENDATEVARLAEDANRLGAARVESERREQDLEKQWNATDRLRREVENQAGACKLAEEKRERIGGESERRQGLVEALSARTADISDLEREAEQAAPTLAAALDRSKQANAVRDEALAALSSAEARQRLATGDRDYRRKQIDVRHLDERYKRVIAAQDALGAAEAHPQAARVDDELLARIQKAQDGLLVAGAAATVGAAALQATALADVTLRVDGRDVALSAGVSHDVRVSDEVELTVPDILTLQVRAGASSRDLVAELAEAKHELQRLCAEGRVADLAAARNAAEERREAERQRVDAVKTIERDLDDLTPEVLKQKVEGMSRGIATYAAERPADPPLPDDYEAAKRIAADSDRELDEYRHKYEAGQRDADGLADALQELRRGEAGLDGRMQAATVARERAEADLEAARRERSDDDLQAAVAVAQSEASTARAALEEAEAALAAADPASLEIRLTNARDTVARSVADLQANQVRLQKLRVSLELRGDRGLAADHDDAVSRCGHLERQHESLEARAQAAHLLHATFAARRAEARRRYVAPFRQRIEQFGRIVFGPTFEVELDDDLRVTRRTLDGITLDTDQLSVGAREQIGVLSRLACAVIVSPDGGGAPVVIDDALGWSDPTRLETMGAAIANAGNECQVIILTCTPGRYAYVGNANTVQLPN